MAMQLLVGVPLEMVHGALRIGLVYVCGILAGESNSAYILGFLFVMRKCFFFVQSPSSAPIMLFRILPFM